MKYIKHIPSVLIKDTTLRKPPVDLINNRSIQDNQIDRSKLKSPTFTTPKKSDRREREMKSQPIKKFESRPTFFRFNESLVESEEFSSAD